MKQGDVFKRIYKGEPCFLLVLGVEDETMAKVFYLTPCGMYPKGSITYTFRGELTKASYQEFLDYYEENALEKHITPQTTQIKKGLEDMANEALKEQRRKEIEEIVDQRLHERGFGLSLEERLKLFYTKFAKPLGGNEDEE